MVKNNSQPEKSAQPAAFPHKDHDYASPPSDAERQNRAANSDSDTTATNSSDEFDWEEDEDFKITERVDAKRGRALWLAFMKLARPVRVLLIGIFIGSILISPFLVVKFRFPGNPVTPHVRLWSLWLTIIWAAGCATYLIVDAIPRLVLLVVVLFGGQVERLKAQVELTMAVSGWLKLALDITWAWISLSVLGAVYRPPGNYWIIINRVIQALFAAGIILLVEKLFLQFVAINFHEKALADRLLENRQGLKALDRLSNAQLVTHRQPPYNKRGHKNPSGSVDFFGLSPRGQKIANHSAEDSPVSGEKDYNSPIDKTLGNRERVGGRRKKRMASVIVDQVGGAIGQVALKNSKFNREGGLGSLHSARRLARKLFGALGSVRSRLIVQDFYPYFRTTVEAHEAFSLFDKDSNGDISKREMREAVQRIYRERKVLIASLKDVSAVVAKLDAVLLAVALVGIIFVSLLVFNRQNTLASLVPLATIILGFSFIFGHSAQTLFESLIFIFSTHVFDVGDLVMIDDQFLFVKEFGLFSTTFRRVDGQEIIAPNALLASTKLVHNLRRSKSMWESTNLMIAYGTPLGIIEELKAKINAYIQANNREWSGCALNIDKMEFQNAIHLVIAIEHRPNWQDWGGRWERRTIFMRALKGILEDLDIRYTMPVQPVLLPRHPSYRGSSTSSNRSEVFGNAGSFRAF